MQASPADWAVGPAAEHQGQNGLAVYNSDRIKSQQRPFRSQNEVLNAGKRSGARRASLWRLSHYLLEADRKKKKGNKSHQAKKVHLPHIRLQLRYHHHRHPRAPLEALAHADAEHTRTPSDRRYHFLESRVLVTSTPPLHPIPPSPSTPNPPLPHLSFLHLPNSQLI